MSMLIMLSLLLFDSVIQILWSGVSEIPALQRAIRQILRFSYGAKRTGISLLQTIEAPCRAISLITSAVAIICRIFMLNPKLSTGATIEELLDAAYASLEGEYQDQIRHLLLT